MKVRRGGRPAPVPNKPTVSVDVKQHSATVCFKSGSVPSSHTASRGNGDIDRPGVHRDRGIGTICWDFGVPSVAGIDPDQ